MSTTFPDYFPAPLPARVHGTFTPSQQRMLAGARALAHLFDDKFRILGFRFGIESIVGLIPGVGDAISSIASVYLLLVAIQLRMPPSKLLRMALNAGFDFVIGLVPFLGDLVDMVFKAHVRNLRIIEEHVRTMEGAPYAARGRR